MREFKMIRVIRIKRDAQGQLIQPSAGWFRVSAQNRTQLENVYNTGGRTFVYNDHYRHQEVKQALEQIFNYKCCYCERKMIDGGFDVEHYRPKGKPKECVTNTHFGYYWLVYEWNNLYLACERCNEPRIDRGSWNRVGTGRTAGKHHSFKLSTPASRAIDHNSNLNLEDPLLIDPCNDFPENHLTFDINGNITTVATCPRGQETISVIGLDRHSLIQFRKEVIHKAIEHLRVGFEALQNGNTVMFNREVDLYLRLTKDHSEFSAAVKSIVRDPISFGLYNELAAFPIEFQNIINRL